MGKDRMGCDRGRYEFRAMFVEWAMRVTSALKSGAAALVLAGALPAGAGAQQPATAATSLVFDGVTVVDVERGKLVPDQRVVVAGNRIRAVGRARAVRLPKNARVVDA